MKLLYDQDVIEEIEKDEKFGQFAVKQGSDPKFIFLLEEEEIISNLNLYQFCDKYIVNRYLCFA
jgi:hypothetical protein